MKINLKKEKFQEIDKAFAILKEAPESPTVLNIIEDALKSCFGCEFNVQVINGDGPLFIMSVFPEVSTVEKMLDISIHGDTNGKAIKKLWEQNKKWMIEIDGRLLTDPQLSCTDRELTALLLHEIGHVSCSNSMPSRVSTILQYEMSRTKMSTKMLLQDKIFRNIMALPILDACVGDGKKDKSQVKNEVKADSYASKMGYKKELYSVLTKFIGLGTTHKEDSISQTAKFSLETLDQFKARKDTLAKRSLLALKEACQSPYIESVVEDIYESFYKETGEETLLGKSFTEMVHEKADRLYDPDEYFKEFFIFGGKKLKRIDPAELDYIDVKTQSIHNDSDKMMLISYLHSKLDIIDYYISILENPKLAKRYNVPHTMDQLQHMRKRLLMSRDAIMKYQIPERSDRIMISYPDGYEG